MKSLFRRRKREGGWLAISVEPGALLFAHGISEPSSRGKVTRCGRREIADPAKDFERLARELEVDRYQCLTILGQDQYHLILVEAPNVPAPELKAAVRWRGGYWPITKHHIDVDAPGLGSVNLASFPFEHLRRPIFPLDADAHWP